MGYRYRYRYLSTGRELSSAGSEDRLLFHYVTAVVPIIYEKPKVLVNKFAVGSYRYRYLATGSY